MLGGEESAVLFACSSTVHLALRAQLSLVEQEFLRDTDGGHRREGLLAEHHEVHAAEGPTLECELTATAEP